MRIWQQLRAEAEATGFFEGYVGDGATIPWQGFPGPIGYTLLTYKLYLDARWPAAFKLHDWLYTSLGQLISVTRDEADRALFDMIALDSPVDAAVVFLAVRLGGANYFGTSQTGLGSRNMRLVSTRRSRPMATKVVMIFKVLLGEVGGDNRIAGFSEGVWHPSNDVAEINRDMLESNPNGPGLAVARATLLPPSARIHALKYYKGGSGKGQSFAVSLVGGSVFTDVPQMALLMSAQSASTGRVRRWWLHCIPDAYVLLGEYKPNTGFRRAVQRYVDQLASFQFVTKAAPSAPAVIVNVVSVPPVAPATIPSAIVTFTAPPPFVAGDIIEGTTFFIGPDGSRNPVGFREYVSLVAVNQVSLYLWPYGNCVDGTASTTSAVDNAFVPAKVSPVRIGVKRVGRPFDLYRGRRAKRRRRR